MSLQDIIQNLQAENKCDIPFDEFILEQINALQENDFTPLKEGYIRYSLESTSVYIQPQFFVDPKERFRAYAGVAILYAMMEGTNRITPDFFQKFNEKISKSAIQSILTMSDPWKQIKSITERPLKERNTKLLVNLYLSEIEEKFKTEYSCFKSKVPEELDISQIYFSDIMRKKVQYNEANALHIPLSKTYAGTIAALLTGYLFEATGISHNFIKMTSNILRGDDISVTYLVNNNENSSLEIFRLYASSEGIDIKINIIDREKKRELLAGFVQYLSVYKAMEVFKKDEGGKSPFSINNTRGYVSTNVNVDATKSDYFF